MLLVPQLGMSATGGVFAPFLGSWKGSGEVTVNDGHRGADKLPRHLFGFR